MLTKEAGEWKSYFLNAFYVELPCYWKGYDYQFYTNETFLNVTMRWN